MTAPLADIRVLDFSRILAGPWCTQVLADLGAEVIKVERPVTGDDTRAWGPPFLKTQDGADTTDSAYFASTNRGKQSVTLDVASPEGQEIARGLAAKCDVFVENYKVGDMKRYGLDYESLAAINPRLIYCSVTGFGQTGPYQNRAGYDFMIQAMGGLMSITGERDELPGGGPQKAGVPIADLMTGMYGAVAILGALRERDTSGKGQYIDMALLDVGMAVLANQAAGFLNTGQVPQRQGNTHPSLAPYQTFATADGSMLLAIGNDGQFARFCEAAGHPEWAQDARFRSNSLRVNNREALIPLLQAITGTRSTAGWIDLLEGKAVPCGPINNLAQAFADDQVIARGLIIKQPVEHTDKALPATDSIASSRTVQTVASPLRLTKTPPVVCRPPPALGQHTEEVLAELGLDATAIAALRGRGVI